MGGEEGMSATRDQRVSQCHYGEVHQLSVLSGLTQWLALQNVQPNIKKSQNNTSGLPDA